MKRMFVGALLGALASTASGAEIGDASWQGTVSSDSPVADLVRAPVSVDELRLALIRSDPLDIVFALDEVEKTAVAPGVLEILTCAYTKCDARDDNWHPVVFENEFIRVNLLAILSQNLPQEPGHDMRSDYRRDAVGFLSSADPLVFRIAMTVVARVGHKEDTVRLEAKALAVTDDVSLNVAIASLASMSNGYGRLPEAQEAIDRIRASVDPRRRDMIDGMLEQMR